MQTSDYKELKVWQKAIELTIEVYRIVKFLPNEEKYALSDQLRRAAVSIPSNIAEGYGRNYDKEFIKFLLIARGSLLEVETQLIISNRLGFIKESDIYNAKSLIIEVGKMINGLLSYRMKNSN